MNLLIALWLISIISIFIPHKDMKYNLSWWSRWLITISVFMSMGYVAYKLIK